MSICKDCIHYPVCIPYVSPYESFPEVEGGCTAFRDRGDFVDYRNIPDIKADAHKEGYAQGVKDFAERVKTYYRHTSSRPLPATVEYYIDQIAKEMLEEDK